MFSNETQNPEQVRSACFPKRHCMLSDPEESFQDPKPCCDGQRADEMLLGAEKIGSRREPDLS